MMKWKGAIIVGICGRMCSGKSRLAERITCDSGMNCAIISFAQEVKRYANELFGVETNGSNKNRAVIQKFAEAMKEIDQDIWVKKTKKLIDETKKTGGIDIIVIDDLRFPNEYEMLRQYGAIIIKLEISPEEQRRRIYEKYENAEEHIAGLNHISESWIDSIYADKEYDENYKVDEVLDYILER